MLGVRIDVEAIGGTSSVKDISETADAAVQAVSDGASVLITGPQGTGKCTVLREVLDGLAEAGLRVRQDPIDPPSPDPDRVVVVDALERASPEVVEALAAHPGRVVAVFESGRHQRAYATHVLNAVYGARPLGRDTESVRRFHLDPWTDEDMARFLHQHSSQPLDSAAIDAITALALGRRSWALDLLGLFAQHQVQTDPYPSISTTLAPGESPLPALQRLRASLGVIPDDDAAAAVALSEIDPLDELALGALVESTVVETLTAAGILVPAEQTPYLVVPGLVAAALRQQSPLDLVDRWRQRIANGLLAQEKLGLPLSERDTIFCVRALSAAGTVREEFVEVHRDLVVRAIGNLTIFGTPAQVRTAVLASAKHDLQLPALPRARAMAALGNTREAIDVLDAIADDDVASRISASLVRHVLLAESGQPAARPDDGLDPSADLVVRLWNRTGPLGDDVPRLRAIADQHADPLIATLAALLVDLDAVWGGLVPPYSSSLQAPRPLPALRMPPAATATDAEGVVLAAQALVLLVAGESAARREPLMEITERLPDRDYHRRWLRHAIAAGTAATFGEMVRAVAEWDLLTSSMPRLLPLRLQHVMGRIGAGMRAVADPRREPDDLATLSEELPYRISLYFAGLHGPLQRYRATLDSRPGTLALVRLARAHLDAAGDRNPAQLVRIAEHFETYQMWLPSAYALSDARQIYLGRRAVGKVRECNEAIARVRAEIARHAPWREPDVVDMAISLTPRELAAARLAAQGLRNREIAERLECSVRTVESHIAQARAKLGAATREDLARLLPRVDPI